jgi:hypothetical protein
LLTPREASIEVTRQNRSSGGILLSAHSFGGASGRLMIALLDCHNPETQIYPLLDCYTDVTKWNEFWHARFQNINPLKACIT